MRRKYPSSYEIAFACVQDFHITRQRYRPVGGKKRFKIRVCAPLPQDLVEICSEAGIPISEEERLGGLFKSESGKEQDFHPVADGEIPDVNGCWIPQRANEIK
jgi:hypothetical protein